MDNKKIPTYAGTIIILIFTFTASLFVVKIEERKNAEETQIKNMTALNRSSAKIKKVDLAVFGNNKAYTTKRDDRNYVILEENGIETIIDKGEAENTENPNDTIENFNDTLKVISFGNLKFSNTGKYLLYEKYRWEYMGVIIYNMEKQQNITEIAYPTNIGFSKDDKYLFMCTSAGIGSGPDGEVYSLPDMTVKFDLVKGEKEESTSEFLDVDCKYDANKNEVLFKMSGYDMWSEALKDKMTEKIYTLE